MTMVDVKISGLTAASPLAAADLFEIVQGTGNRKLTAAQLALFVRSTVNLTGLYSARPTAAAAGAGAIYYATDTLECYRSDGSAWGLTMRGGAELGHSDRSTPYATTSLTFADIPGLAVDYVAGEGAAFASFCGTGKTNTVNAGVAAIFVDGAQASQVLYTNQLYLTLSSGIRITGKTPGTTVAVRIRGRASNTGSQFDLFGDPVDRPFLRVVTG